MNLGASVATAKLNALASGDPWRRIEREFASTGDAATVQRGLTEAIDALVAKAYQAAVEPVLPQGAALLAWGEYGRAQLFPYSDVNVLIVLETERSWVALREVLSEFVRELWDLGLRVNHSVRTIAECLDVRDENLDLKIGVLDGRLVAGNQYVHAQLHNRLPEFLGKQAQKLAQQLCHEARLRYAKHHQTFRHLQPDVQETPGGIRDLQLIRWLARLGAERQPVSDSFGPAASFLATARCFLHYRARGDRNLLDFAAQESIAQQPFSRHESRVEWMREYYGHAALVSKCVRRALESSEKTESSLLGNFREWRSRLSNTDFTVSRDRLLLRNPGQIEEDTDLLLRLIEFMARHDIGPSASTDSRLEAARPALAAYCATPRPMWATLKNILALPHIGTALRALQNTGLLSALFPEWKHVENLSNADHGHSYTVDEHVLVACERVGELRNTSDPARRRFSELLSEIDNPAVLLFALLYHDMGKDSPGGDSLRLSVARAATGARRIGMPPDEQSDVEFLIEHQLNLAEGMSTRDPADPATPRWLAKRIGTIERLRLLAILTYADMSSAHSDSMSPWRMDQLWLVHQV
ncbi:MAG TPA: hypothetical protein VN754_10655, partial [Candidatus Binataceae bacterium]|nr:hypothetical protein [Candidatus Binataceae bacterium]